MQRRWNILYRPRNFQSVVGQEHVVLFFQKVLANWFEKKDLLPIGVLFGGPSGVGKTTLARVVAASLNCSNRNGVEPCGECKSCRDIFIGAGGILEIDAAFFGLVDNVRNLRQRLSSYAFTSYQVVILDECHMMSREAFNVLLKLLEEPLDKVFFILVTTATDKVIETVRSRLIEFRFKSLKWTVVYPYISNLLRSEGVSCESEDIVKKLYTMSDYNFRELLVMLEQAAVVGDGKISFDVVQRLYGNLSVFDSIIDALVEGDFVRAINEFDEYKSMQSDFSIFLSGFLDVVTERLRTGLRTGDSRSPIYLAIIKSVYELLGMHLTTKGDVQAKLLFANVVQLVRGAEVGLGAGKALNEEDVFNLLTRKGKSVGVESKS
jgi:DNA polymerase III subunit gamma/tau